MKKQQDLDEYLILEEFSQEMKELFAYCPQKCEEKILEVLSRYPDAPQPQNLLGILAEYKNNKILAMKHYRAAWALAADYSPSSENISRLAELDYHRQYYFHVKDVQQKNKDKQQNSCQFLRRILG